MTNTKTWRVGIDLGGTKVALGLVDAKGTLVDWDRFGWDEIPNWREQSAKELTEHLVERVLVLVEKHGVEPTQLQAVGLGFPGDFATPSGRLKTAPNLPAFVDSAPSVLLHHAFERRLGTAPPVFADNDTVAAVLAEALFGSGQGTGRVLYITVSTGVGGARFDGEKTTNIEPGLSLFPDPDRPLLNLEQLASGAHLKQIARRQLTPLLGHGKASLAQHTQLFNLVEIPGSSRQEQLTHLTTRHLGEAAAAGDAFCRSLFEDAAHWVAAGLAEVLTQGWGEECIVMGGSIILKVPGFLEHLRERLRLHQQQPNVAPGLATFDLDRGLVIAGLGDKGGMLGAVLLAPDEGRVRRTRRRAVRTITASQARSLRQAVLRPNQPPEACVYDGDEDPQSAHFGAVAEQELVGIVSIYQQREDGQRDPFAWRLRGMATLETVRGQGFGVALLEACMQHARSQGGMRLWCNARTTVAGFYGGFGFEVQGKEFDLPGLGPHVVMALEL
jgi:predicted NBD/HSP70 family sugar kinase/predicted GNAT family N-acyltransferase